MITMTGSRSRIVHRPLPQDDPRQRRPDISQAQELLNWRPTVMLTEGLQRTIAYFEALHSKDRKARSRRPIDRTAAIRTEAQGARGGARPCCGFLGSRASFCRPTWIERRLTLMLAPDFRIGVAADSSKSAAGEDAATPAMAPCQAA